VSRHGQRGASLLEGLVALALIGIAILVAAAFLDTQAIATDRVQAQAELVLQLEAAVEGMRAGTVPLHSGALDPMPQSLPRSAEVDELALSAQILPLEPPGLVEVTLNASCRTRRGRQTKTVTTRIWRPL